MGKTVRAYAITADAVARERERVGGDAAKMDVANVIALDKLELRDVGPGDRDPAELGRGLVLETPEQPSDRRTRTRDDDVPGHGVPPGSAPDT
jgi:hypothetical protein